MITIEKLLEKKESYEQLKQELINKDVEAEVNRRLESTRAVITKEVKDEIAKDLTAVKHYLEILNSLIETDEASEVETNVEDEVKTEAGENYVY